MKRGDLIAAVSSSAVFVLLTVVLIVLNVKNGPRAVLAAFAATTAQLAVLSFWWLAYRRAKALRTPLALKVIAIVCLVISLMILAGAAWALVTAGPRLYILWMPFLSVHIIANVVLARRPAVYMVWIACAWVVAPVLFGAQVLMGFIAKDLTHSPPMEIYGRVAQSFTAGISQGDALIIGIFFLISMQVFAATTLGVAFACILSGWKKLQCQETSAPPLRNVQ